MLPYPDSCLKLQVTGQVIKDALEESVSLYPEAEAKFLAVSGLKFTFDPSKSANSRIKATDILLPSGKPINLRKEYTVALNNYIGSGGDGYDMFTREGVKTLVDHENTLQVIDLLTQFFKRTSTSYKVKPVNEARRQMRLSACNTSSTDPDDVSQDGKWIMIRPKVEERITILNT